MPFPDDEKWLQWRRKSGGKGLIAIDQIRRYAWVVITFLGFDLNRGEGAPLLYMIVVNGSRLGGILLSEGLTDTSKYFR